MSKPRKEPLDQPARDRLVTVFDRNVLVEAGAGSGKTHSLASRMAGGIAAGVYSVERMAAVTFTAQGRGELRGRFRLALEDRLARADSPEARARLEAALTGIERLFAGTIHAFCAHLLRERPIDAGLAPGFVELDDLDNLRLQQQAVARLRGRGAGQRVRADARPPRGRVQAEDLYDAFAKVCEHEDVEFDRGGGEAPDFDATLKAVETFWQALTALTPKAFAPDTKCPVQHKYGRVRRPPRQPAAPAAPRLAQRSLRVSGDTQGHDVLWARTWGATPRTVRGPSASWRRSTRRRRPVPGRVARLRFTGGRWRVLDQARAVFAEKRRRDNTVNYVDLLRRTSAMLRDRADVRLALQQKYRWLFVDEFQDTDPIQAEIFLMLAGDEPHDLRSAGSQIFGARSFGPAAGSPPCDPSACRCVPARCLWWATRSSRSSGSGGPTSTSTCVVRQRIEATGARSCR